MYDVICVGILVADAIAKTVDKLPETGKLDLVNRLDLYTGGCAVNSGIALSRLGINATVMGKIGDDGFGKFILRTLEDEGVDTKGLVIDKNESTSASVVLVDSSGERSFLHCLGANGVFSDRDVNYDIIADSKIVFVAGTMLMPGFDGDPCARVLKRAKEMGKTTALDTAWDSTGRWMEVLDPCIPYIDIFMPSYEEAVQLSNKKEPEDISDVFLKRGIETVIIKLGKDGCFIKDNTGRKYLIPTYEDIKPVDTTGAGDSFAAGFLTGIIKGLDLYECGKLANAVGTHCVMEVGASTGIKSYDEIRQFMASYE